MVLCSATVDVDAGDGRRGEPEKRASSPPSFAYPHTRVWAIMSPRPRGGRCRRVLMLPIGRLNADCGLGELPRFVEVTSAMAELSNLPHPPRVLIRGLFLGHDHCSSHN